MSVKYISVGKLDNVFLAFVSAFLLFKIFFAYYTVNGFAFADWLINYQDGGFKRRGLIGAFVFFTYTVLGIRLQYTVFLIQFIVIFSFFFYLRKLLAIKKHDVLEYFFLLTPLCLWGIFSDAAVGVRKDGLTWFLLIFFAYHLVTKKTGNRMWILFLVFFSFSVFVHESSIFFFPCFIAIYLFNTQKIEGVKVLLIALSFIIPGLIVFFFGKSSLGGTYTIDAIRASGIELQESNIFDWKETGGMKLDFYRHHAFDYSLYFVSAFLQFLYVIFYLYIKNFSRKQMNSLVIVFTLCVFACLPLFLIAIDAGRWLYTLFIFWAILIITQIESAPAVFVGLQNAFGSLRTKKGLVFCVVVILSDVLYRVPSVFIGMQYSLPIKYLFLKLNQII